MSKVFREATKFDQSRTFDWSRVVANVYSEDSNEEEFERERVVLFSEICKLSHVSANALTVLDLVDYPTLEDAQLLYIVCTYTHLKTILLRNAPYCQTLLYNTWRPTLNLSNIFKSATTVAVSGTRD